MSEHNQAHDRLKKHIKRTIPAGSGGSGLWYLPHYESEAG